MFNIVIDAVLRAWKEGSVFGKSSALFYADNGLIENTAPVELKQDLDMLIKLFEQLGLQTNKDKTKYMVF